MNDRPEKKREKRKYAFTAAAREARWKGVEARRATAKVWVNIKVSEGTLAMFDARRKGTGLSREVFLRRLLLLGKNA